MSNNLPPFEQAQENIRKFAESADLMQSMSELKQLLEDSKKLSDEEQEGVSVIIEMAILSFAKHMIKKGERWN